MAKKNAPAGTSRKPPEPTDDHAEIARWIDRAMPDLQPILAHVDGLIRKTLPGLQYALKWKKAYYGLPDRDWIIELVAYDVSVNIVFFAGATFDPPPPLGEGSRYVKLRTLEDARAPEIRAWIEQAGKAAGWT